MPRTAARSSLVLFAAIALTGCAAFSLDPGVQYDMEVREIRRLPDCGAREPDTRIERLDLPADVLAWQQTRGVDLVGPDFAEEGPFALVEHGARDTGGYGLAISHYARMTFRGLELTASFLEPPAGSTPDPTPTSPCVLVVLPTGRDVAVLLVDPSGKRRAYGPAGGTRQAPAPVEPPVTLPDPLSAPPSTE